VFVLLNQQKVVAWVVAMSLFASPNLSQKEPFPTDKSKPFQQSVSITVTSDGADNNPSTPDIRSYSDFEDSGCHEHLYVGRNSSPDLRKCVQRRSPRKLFSRQRKSDHVEAKYREDVDPELVSSARDMMSRSNSLDYSAAKSNSPTPRHKKLTNRLFKSFAPFDKRSLSLQSSSDSLDQLGRGNSQFSLKSKSSTLPPAFKPKAFFHLYGEDALKVSVGLFKT